jgi:hypothetical protein
MRLFLRLILVIPLGIIGAIVTAIAVYLVAFGFPAKDFSAGAYGGLPPVLVPALVLSGVIARWALLPFLVAIAFAEWRRYRQLTGWVLFGGALGCAIQLFGLPGNDALLAPAAAGFAGGFVYFLIAGRGAGGAAS